MRQLLLSILVGQASPHAYELWLGGTVAFVVRIDKKLWIGFASRLFKDCDLWHAEPTHHCKDSDCSQMSCHVQQVCALQFTKLLLHPNFECWLCVSRACFAYVLVHIGLISCICFVVKGLRCRVFGHRSSLEVYLMLVNA